MEKCYEYFDCKETNCIMFSKETKDCWNFSDETHCNNPNFKDLGPSKCTWCIYYRKSFHIKSYFGE